MKTPVGPIAWFVTGAAFGFGGLALAFGSLGVIALLPAVAIGVVLLVFRIRPPSMLLVGAGSAMALLQWLHITSGDTPDNQLWPILLGLALASVGLLLLLRGEPRADV